MLGALFHRGRKGEEKGTLAFRRPVSLYRFPAVEIQGVRLLEGELSRKLGTRCDGLLSQYLQLR